MVEVRPPYCEAHPRLIGSQVRRAYLSDDALICRFKSESGAQRGWLEVIDVDRGCFSARWRIFAPWSNPRPGAAIFPFSPPSGKAGRPAPFTCPDCERQVANLIFVEQWACRECHGLVYRSTLLDANVRAEEWRAERLVAVQELIGLGRPKGMRHATFRALRLELTQLQRTARGSLGATANRERLARIDSEWIPYEVAHSVHGFDRNIVFGRLANQN